MAVKLNLINAVVVSGLKLAMNGMLVMVGGLRIPAPAIHQPSTDPRTDRTARAWRERTSRFGERYQQAFSGFGRCLTAAG